MAASVFVHSMELFIIIIYFHIGLQYTISNKYIYAVCEALSDSNNNQEDQALGAQRIWLAYRIYTIASHICPIHQLTFSITYIHFLLLTL